MKIDPILNPNIIKSYQALKPVSNVRKVASKRDEVSFSEEALSFSKAMEEARDAIESRTPEERARLAELANAVRRGEYSVGSDLVADKILESVLRR